MTPFAALRLSEYSTLELYRIVSQKDIHGEDRSACVQRFKKTTEKDEIEGLVGLPACDLASILLVLMKISARFLEKIELTRRASIVDVNIGTYVEICKFTETSKVPSIGPHIITRSERKENKFCTLEASVDYPEENIYDQLSNMVYPNGNETRQFSTKSVNLYDEDRCHAIRKRKDHAATYYNSS